MPKLVGHTPHSHDRHVSDAPQDEVLVPLTYAQAARVRAAGGRVYYWLDTSDRGGPGRLAKRWYHWEAEVRDVLRASPTESMYHRAARACMPPGMETRDLAEWADAQRREEEARRAEVTRRCEQLQAHARPECVRVVPGPTCTYAIEVLHDCGGAFYDRLPADMESAAAMIRSIQDGHDRVYHASASEGAA